MEEWGANYFNNRRQKGFKNILFLKYSGKYCNSPANRNDFALMQTEVFANNNRLCSEEHEEKVPTT